MPAPESSFYITGGTLPLHAASYAERRADKELFQSLVRGEFCYLLTARQMGKSSMMIRAVKRLRDEGANVAAIDLTMIGQNLTPEQWYDGLLVNLGRQLRLEDELEQFWLSHTRWSAVQRWFAGIREIILPKRPGPLVIFLDEIDAVRSLPFAADEFFAAIRGCYNRRVEDREFDRLTFCLLGIATPGQLIRDPHMTPFTIGRRIELTDFTTEEARPLAAALTRCAPANESAHHLLDRILYWTHGHPYLTQRLCQGLVEGGNESVRETAVKPERGPTDGSSEIDVLTETLFLSTRARERDDNLLFVRERLLRTESLANLLDLYRRVWHGESIRDDGNDELINGLRLSGIVRTEAGQLTVRNRIYHRVFDSDWIQTNIPEAELEKPDGSRLKLKGNCSIGRSSANDIALVDDRISRRHAVIQRQTHDEFWLMDLESSNGTYLNGRRITAAERLRDRDQIRIAGFSLIFHQLRAPRSDLSGESSITEKTLLEYRPPAP